ncbi:androgen-induced gene 1 protein-like isoform X2 [Atheta coriaria]|uniref:androgen-induced gene 1 protein-like isoform X2 n=1 Tax=Dalotia coriaria TaxID=877792 RepID=UPI0031F3BF1D
MWRFLLRSLALTHFLFTLYYDWFYIFPPHDIDDNSVVPWFRPYKFKYLTFWDVVLQAVFFGICVLADLVAKDDQSHVLRRLQNRIMVSLAYPLAMFVGVTFWAIYLVDRELILPKAMDVFFPVWLNHCMHTNIVVFMLIEFITTSYAYEPRARNVKILLSVMVSYLIWLFVIYSATGVWVYPILHVLSWPLKIAFIIGCLGLVLGLYVTGEKLNKALRGEKEVVVIMPASSVAEMSRASPPPPATSAGNVKKEK